MENTVSGTKGLSFTELKKETGLSNGVLQHHIRKSENIVKKKGAILEKGACTECSFEDRCGDKCLQKVLRKPVNQKVIQKVENGTTQTEIAEELGLDRSTVNYHVKKLERYGLL